MSYNSKRISSWQMTSCYYPLWKNSHSAFSHYNLHEKSDVILCVVAEFCIAPPNSSPLVRHRVKQHQTSSPPADIISWPAVFSSCNILLNLPHMTGTFIVFLIAILHFFICVYWFSIRALPSRYTTGYLQRCFQWVVTEMFTVDPILPFFLRVQVSIWTVL